MFTFAGPLESSKSWMNRALVIQYYNPLIEINGHTESDDVQNLINSIQSLKQGQSDFFSGAGGTTLRFFSFLISRQPGTWRIRADQRLLERPQTEIQNILKQLGVQVSREPECLTLLSQGWKIPKIIDCHGQNSSQFISGLLLNSWNLPQDLLIQVKKPIVSFDYLKMTLEMVQRQGLKIESTEDEVYHYIKVKAFVKPSANPLQAEPDISSAFSLASAGLIGGHVQITNWPQHSLQPDYHFLNIFKKMNILFKTDVKGLHIQQQKNWSSTTENLVNTPDLFPVLAVICALGTGQSYLYGADNLKAKESNRFLKTIELLHLCGFKTEIKAGGLFIYGQSSVLKKDFPLVFDPDHDHRMAMAAGLLKLAGYSLKISNSVVVNKSYPAFWHDIQVLP